MAVPHAQAGQALTGRVATAGAEAGRGRRLPAADPRWSAAWSTAAAPLVLVLVKLVVSFPPTKVDADIGGVGPVDRTPTNPVTWKVTVTSVGEHKYQYEFEGRDKTMPTAPSPSCCPACTPPRSTPPACPSRASAAGNFTLDWDARNTLPAPPRDPLNNQPDVGKATYTLRARQRHRHGGGRRPVPPGAATTITPASGSTPTTATARRPAAGGSMEFVHAAPQNMTSKGATWAVKSRWTQDGRRPLGREGPGRRHPRRHRGHGQRVLGHQLRQPLRQAELGPAGQLRRRGHRLRVQDRRNTLACSHPAQAGRPGRALTDARPAAGFANGHDHDDHDDAAASAGGDGRARLRASRCVSFTRSTDRACTVAAPTCCTTERERKTPCKRCLPKRWNTTTAFGPRPRR